MKPKFLITALFASLFFYVSFAQPVTQWIFVRSLVSDNKSDTIMLYYYSSSRYTPLVPGRVLIKSRTDTIKEIRVENGSSQRLTDGSFAITIKNPYSGDFWNMTFIGHSNYAYRISRIITPSRYFVLKNYSTNLNQPVTPQYTVDDIVRYGKIVGYNNSRMDSVFRIKEFQILVRFYTSRNMKENTVSSPVFKGDSIPSAYAESLKKYFKGSSKPLRLFIIIQNVKVTGSDSVICKNGYNSSRWMVYKDSVNMHIETFVQSPVGSLDRHLATSNLRIRVEGNPLPGDLATVSKIVNEINSLKVNIKAKFVRFFPSLVIQIDSSDTSFGRSRLTTYGEKQVLNQNVSQTSGSELITREMRREEASLFFPKLSYSSIFVSTSLKDQNARDLFLWQQITRSLADFYSPGGNRNFIIPLPGKSPGYSRQDRLALKAIFSPDFYDRVKEIRGPEPRVQSNVFLIVSISLILFFIFYEINNYFSFNRFISNPLLRNSIYAILIAQVFVLTSIMVSKGFIDHLLLWEIYICGFAIITGWLFLASDGILIKYFKISWLKLLLNPLLTIFSLWLAYQIIYLFERAEFLRLITIDSNAKIIGLSVIAVRFYLQYENEKITSLLREKDFEVTRHKELKNRAELSTLQAKINPHFLYNALNSIAALAHIDSSRTEEMALSLSKLFRYNMNREEDMLSTIGQEIEMVKLYLQIEKQRYTDRLSFNISANENLNERQVPRFLIQPLVENAIKHGISKITGPGVIKLKIYEKGKNLFIEIHDNGPEFPQGLITGYGLQNTYDKLTLVYKKPYEIRFVNEPEKYIQIKL
jgi:sensor histidine kinase YesM